MKTEYRIIGNQIARIQMESIMMEGRMNMCTHDNGRKSDDCLRCNMKEKLSEAELERYQHLKTLSGKRLIALLPTWAKPKVIKPYPPFVPGLPPKFPAWTYHTSPTLPPAKIPTGYQLSMADYVREFEQLNQLKSAQP